MTGCAPLLAVFLVFSSLVSSAKHTYPRAVVVLSPTAGQCSGAVLVTGKVLTAAHCWSEGTTVDGKPAKVAFQQFGTDLVLLDAETDTFPPIRVGRYQVTDEVYLVGTSGKFNGLFRFGRISHIGTSGFVLVDLDVSPGLSGAPVVKFNGQLVCIVTTVPYIPAGGPDLGFYPIGAGCQGGAILQPYLEAAGL